MDVIFGSVLNGVTNSSSHRRIRAGKRGNFWEKWATVGLHPRKLLERGDSTSIYTWIRPRPGVDCGAFDYLTVIASCAYLERWTTCGAQSRQLHIMHTTVVCRDELVYKFNFFYNLAMKHIRFYRNFHVLSWKIQYLLEINCRNVKCALLFIKNASTDS